MGREVLVVDQAKIFKGEELKCRREQARLDSLRRELEEFEQFDQPAFTSWLYSTFAVEMAQLHELRATLSERFSVLHSVETEANRKNTSYEAAYERVSKRTTKKSNAKAEGQADFFDDELPPEDRPERDLPSTPKPRPAGESLKDCYRELVRRLHPDLNRKLTAHQRDLWHQVQKAYQERDLSRLKQLVSMTGGPEGDGEAGRTTLGELRKMFREIKQACTEMMRAIRESKKDPAWGFREILRTPERLARVEARLMIDLAHDIEHAQIALDEIEELMSDWKRPTKAPQRPSHKPAKGRRSRGGRGRSRRR